MVTSYEAFSVLLLLLPGIVGFFLFNGIADIKEKDTLASISWVVFYTIATQVISIQLFGAGYFPKIAGATDVEAERNIYDYIQNLSYIPFLVSAALGIAFAVLKNFSVGYWILNRFRITRRVGARQPWGALFNRKRGVWIIVRFKDGTALVGWPEYYSDDDEKGVQQIYVQDAVWHVPTTKLDTFVPNSAVTTEEISSGGVLLQDMKSVAAIEFVET